MSSSVPRYSQSPYSSTGAAESVESTPDTRLTAFSPEDTKQAKGTTNKTTGTSPSASQQDPFVTTNLGSKGERKLSATASTFQPFGIRTAPSTIGSSRVVTQLLDTFRYLDGAFTTSSASGRDLDITQQGAFSTDMGVSRCIRVAAISGIDARQIVEIAMKRLLEARNPLQGTQKITHVDKFAYLRFSNITDATAVYGAIELGHPDCAIGYISPTTYGRVISPGPNASCSAHEGQVVLRAVYPVNTVFDKKEFEESLRALLSVEGNLVAWQKLSATEAGIFQMVAEFDNALMGPRAVNRCNGKHIATVVVSVEQHRPETSRPMASLFPIVSGTPTRLPGDQSHLVDYLGRMSLGNSGGPELHENIGTRSLGLPLIGSHTAPPLQPNTFPVMGGTYSPPNVPTYQPSYLPTVSQQQLGLDGFNALTSASFANQAYIMSCYNSSDQPEFQFSQPQLGYCRPQHQASQGSSQYDGSVNMRQNATKIPHRPLLRNRNYPNPAAGHHNHVDINRIRQGIDVRTTVMLRNIPNKVDQEMLKSIIDESSFGRYDFMYLRIDFSNDCNVGYAFINFTDPLDIVDFVLARSNQRWHRFKSDKVAEVSYATIQGKDCLVQKFRNSSVMLEPPHYRPKLFFTIHDPFGRAGEEDQFPASDNASKLKRSCENAEHVGLFAPSAGQHLRDEQRRRRSQYDRGTSLAEREETAYDEDDMHPLQVGYPHY